jgi:hypothetical protein
MNANNVHSYANMRLTYQEQIFSNVDLFELLIQYRLIFCVKFCTYHL